MSATIRDARRGGYESARPDVQALVPTSARRILDLGCASGALGAALKARQGAEVVGVELDPAYAADAEGRLDRVICSDVAAALDDDRLGGGFDCVIAADVLEHTLDPWAILRRAAALVDPGGTVVVSLPNVRYLATFLNVFVRGRWPRHPAGLFDATHLRWFTPADMRELLEQAGLEVDAMQGVLWFADWQRSVVAALARTPLAPFLHGQYVTRGVKR